jgi:hypothetical protein
VESEQREAVGPGTYVAGLADRGDGVAYPVTVDGAVPGALGGDEMHGPILAGRAYRRFAKVKQRWALRAAGATEGAG